MLHFCRIIIPNWNADILRKLGKNITKKNKFNQPAAGAG